MVTGRTLRLRLLKGDKERFYDIRISKDNGTWTTTTTFGRIGFDSTTIEIFSGSSLENSVLAGERFEIKKKAEGYVRISGSLRRG